MSPPICSPGGRRRRGSEARSAVQRFDAAFRRCAIGELLQAVRGPVHELIALAHFLTGGSSPVATRQIFEAARLAASVAAAASDA